MAPPEGQQAARIIGELGKKKCFDETLEPWDTYIERVEQYFKANDVQNEKNPQLS